MVAVSSSRAETVFDFTWKQVVIAYWNRYPNPASTHVLTEDTIKREVRDGKLYSRRLLSKTNPVPKWGERFYKNVPIKIIEDSVLDLKEKTLTTFTRNIGMKKIMKVDEIVVYSEQKDGRTLAVRHAYISSQVFGFSRAIRAFGIERFKSNSTKASNGFNYVLRKMFPNNVIASGLIDSKAMPLAAMGAVPTATKINDNNNNMNAGTTNTTATTTTAVASGLSKTEAIKKTTKAGYEFFKCHASKIAQLFSIRN